MDYLMPMLLMLERFFVKAAFGKFKVFCMLYSVELCIVL